MLPGNDNRITAAILGSQKAGNQEKVSCFFAPVFVKCCYENTKRFSGELCQIFLPVRSNNDGKNIAVKLAEAPPSPSRVSAKASTAESVTFLELYRKVSYPDICKTPSKHKPIEDTIRDKILPTRWMKYIKNSG